MNEPAPVLCGGKVRYTRAYAKHCAESIRQRHSTNADVYRCVRCSGWHVGTTTGARNAPGRKHKRALRALREGEFD
ncbi:MAG TPA: hypothetical protein VNU71_13370 [Burkholderiaceae bacterium]|nr:hypothetical protein [Burkholderiaceae bacterium]